MPAIKHNIDCYNRREEKHDIQRSVKIFLGACIVVSNANRWDNGRGILFARFLCSLYIIYIRNVQLIQIFSARSKQTEGRSMKDSTFSLRSHPRLVLLIGLLLMAILALIAYNLFNQNV